MLLLQMHRMEMMVRCYSVDILGEHPAEGGNMEIIIQVSKTSDGKSEFVQIMSPAAVPINIVLVVDKVTIEDRR
jgi:hypothetical protein